MAVERRAGPASPMVIEPAASYSRWAYGWRRFVFSTYILFLLVFVAESVHRFSRGTGVIGGYAVLAAFCGCYLAILAGAQSVPLPDVSQMPARRFWLLCALLAALAVAELPFARLGAFVMCVYITIITVSRIGTRSAPIVGLMALAALMVPPAIPSWHEGIAASAGSGLPFGIPVFALAVFGNLQAQRGNRELARARAQMAVMAAENERLRISRNLHDLLGHSLTTITVKAGLARRLGQADPGRALGEIAEVEVLARQSLAEVRAAVASYRKVTLAAELASARDLLRAAGITADLPRDADAADPACRELFGWAVREGVTNVVRHSHASWCAIQLSARSIEILDDGTGSTAPPGNGLTGLRERAAAAGAVVHAGPGQPRGWRVRVTLPPQKGDRR